MVPLESAANDIEKEDTIAIYVDEGFVLLDDSARLCLDGHAKCDNLVFGKMVYL